MALTRPCEGYPLPGHEIPECNLSPENLDLLWKWTKANGSGYSIRDRSWIHRIVKALLKEVLADRCPPGGKPRG